MYNPYQPYNYGSTYIPNFNFQNPYQQFNPNLTQQQTQPQNQQSSATNTNKIFVSSLDDVKSKSLPFNFEINEIKAQDSQKQPDTINLSNYVTLTEFEILKGQIDELKNKITKMSVQSELNALTSTAKTKEKLEVNNGQSSKQ